MSEQEKNEQGACPSCGSPSYAGHTADCPANKQTDEKLSLEEAQNEARQVRERAVYARAEKAVKIAKVVEPVAEVSAYEFERHFRETSEQINKQVKKIKRGKSEQPTKKDYEKAFGEQHRAERVVKK